MRILNVTAQKPHSTGSGVYLTETVRQFAALGHQTAVVAGVCVIAAAGFRFGKHLRQGERAQAVQVEQASAVKSDA